MKLPKIYEPHLYETDIYALWEKSGVFEAHPERKAERFTISMPPPNATGSLHVGHALGIALQDIMIRYARMQGKDALWIPGTDHAALATNAIMEKRLAEEGTNKHEIGREAFVGRLKEFIDGSQGSIRSQIRAVGASSDWSRERYTLDDALNRCVNETFVSMYNDGLIYRGSRIVNWDPNLETTVSDDEVVRIEETGKFYTFQYGPFQIGTARPETKFGDKYVVMHPDDERYKQYEHGQKFEAEWINGTITATVIKDEATDPSFGTGVMTITPWHDLTDFEIAERHGLDMEQVIDFHGKLLPIAGDLAGMTIAEARRLVVKKLDAKGLVVKIDENYAHSIAVNERGKGIIEPQVKLQWFVDVNKPAVKWKGKKLSLKAVMQDVVKSGDIDIVPDRFEKTYFHWIDNLRDWCISRQIWWGHRIPVWYRTNAEEEQQIYVGVKPPVDDQSEGLHEWQQDPDTLDTWFSSSLWTWSTLIDPNLAADLDISFEDMLKGSIDFNTYHPTSVLETGWDILFFWVARMILSTTYMVGTVPFKTVYMHGLVRAEDGQKMSKSKPETMIDPMEVIPKYGADALRLALISGTSPGNDQRMSIGKITAQRNFCNKLWNVARYIEDKLISQTPDGEASNKPLAAPDDLANPRGSYGYPIGSSKPPDTTPDSLATHHNRGFEIFGEGSAAELTLEPVTNADHWVLWKLRQSIESVSASLDKYRFGEAWDAVYHFVWDDFADWYIEASKSQLNLGVLVHCLQAILKLAHPFAPFVTETIWQTLNLETDTYLATSEWPKAAKFDKTKAKDFEQVKSLVAEVRQITSELQVIGRSLYYEDAPFLADNADLVKKLTRLKNVRQVESGIGLQLTQANYSAWLDIDSETIQRHGAKLKEAQTDLEKQIARLSDRLANRSYVKQAPKEVVKQTKDQLTERQAQLAKVVSDQTRFS